jgi:hypothetical protein
VALYDTCFSLSGPISSATRGPGALREESPILPRQDIATTVGGPTATREVCVVGRMIRIAVIVGQFFPVSDIPEGDNPDCADRLFNFTVGITGVVAIAGRIPKDRAINIIAVIEGENIDIALGETPGTFGFRNLFPNNWLRVLPMPLTSCRIWRNVILSYTAISFT